MVINPHTRFSLQDDIIIRESEPRMLLTLLRINQLKTDPAVRLQVAERLQVRVYRMPRHIHRRATPRLNRRGIHRMVTHLLLLQVRVLMHSRHISCSSCCHGRIFVVEKRVEFLIEAALIRGVTTR